MATITETKEQHMNKLTINATASEINREHAMAIAHAGHALDHAKRAGELLLGAKAQLPHGEFSEWVLTNVTVSTRQAQRYMAAAQGKPTPLRAIMQKETKTTPCRICRHRNSFLMTVIGIGSQAPGKGWIT